MKESQCLGAQSMTIFSQPLGNENEAMLSAALNYRENGTCYSALPSGMAERGPKPKSLIDFGNRQGPAESLSRPFQADLRCLNPAQVELCPIFIDRK